MDFKTAVPNVSNKVTWRGNKNTEPRIGEVGWGWADAHLVSELLV